MRPLLSCFPVIFAVFGPIIAVKPVWKTPVSEPNPNANLEVLKGHSNLAKRAQPNYYTRPEQVSIPEYRPPRQRLPPLPSPKISYQQVPPHQLTSGGSFRPFAWVGPQPKPGSPQTSYYENSPNKGQFPKGLPPLPPNWQQYPVQMIWIPDTPGQTTGAYPYYPGPAGPPVPVSTGSYGLYGPTVTTEKPMEPSVNPETYTGTVAHSPSANPITTTIPYEPPNPYGGQTQVSPSSNSYPDSTVSTTSSNTESYEQPSTSPSERPRSSTRDFENGNGKTVNPTIRPGPQELSGGIGTSSKPRLPNDADYTRDVETGSSEVTTPFGRNTESSTPSKSPGSTSSSDTTPSSNENGKETTPFEMTKNPFNDLKTIRPIYLGSSSDEEDDEPLEDISKATDSPHSSEKSQIPGSPGSQIKNPLKPSSTESETIGPESSESEDDGERSTPTPQEEEEEMMRNFFPRPVSAQAYQPPGHQPEDFTSHINVNFKRPKGKGGCVTPPCRGVDTDKISLYKPDRDNEDSSPTLVISNAAKDDASRAGYKPAPPLINPYIPPPPPPHPEEEYATPYTVPPGKQPFPPFGEGPATPPRSLIPAHNFPPPSTFPPDEDYHETTTDTVRPTAQTISTRFTAPTTTTTSKPVESTTTEEDTPEHVPPAIVHMTASTPSGKNPPTYIPLHPETSQSTPTPTTSARSTRPTASVTRRPEFPTRNTPPFGGNVPNGPSSTVPPASNPTTEGYFTQVFTDREKTNSGESVVTTTASSTDSETPGSGSFSTSPQTTAGWIYTSTDATPESEYSTASSFPTLSTSDRFTPSESSRSTETTTVITPFTETFESSTLTPDQFEDVTSTFTDRFRPSEYATSPTPPSPTRVVTASFPPNEGSSPGILPSTNPPPRNNPYAPPEGAPRVPNRLIGKPRILCLEDGISFEVKTILPLTGEVFANDRKRVLECHKSFTEEAKPKMFLPFSTCGVKNVGEQVDSRAQYHMQVVLIIDQGNGTNTLQSFMAQCVHQKVNYNKQVLPKRIEEALEELRLVPSKLEQKASMPSVQMQIVVDEGHHKLGAEVSAADIGMPLALKWSMVPESDAYGMHIRNCKVVDAVGKIDHTLIDEQGCSADLQIIDHPHYDTYHDTASAHMWAFKVPDMSSLQIKCDILICSNIKSSVTNTTSCEDIPSPPFCADVVTSPPNSILSDASSFIKHRRASVPSEVSPATQSVRTSICLSKSCRPDFSEEVRICVNTQLATTSTGLSLAFLLFAISFQIIARTKRP